MVGLAGSGGTSRQRISAVTTTNHLPALLKRLANPKTGSKTSSKTGSKIGLKIGLKTGSKTGSKTGRGRRTAVAVVDGVQMSCQELDDDLAVIQFLCPTPRKSRALRPARET
jgi:hypothetical protein